MGQTETHSWPLRDDLLHKKGMADPTIEFITPNEAK